MGLEPASVHASVRAGVGVSTLLTINISETSWPIKIKFYLKHHCYVLGQIGLELWFPWQQNVPIGLYCLKNDYSTFSRLL